MILSTWRTSVIDVLLKPTDPAGLVFFRIAFFGIMLWEVWRFLGHGWVRISYPEFFADLQRLGGG